MSTSIIDVHAHAMPMALMRALEGTGDADLSGLDRGVVTLAPWVSGLAPGAPVPFPPEQHDVNARLQAMDDDGVDVQVVSAPPFLFAGETDDDRRALELTRRTNDALAELVSAAPGRLAALGTVPAGRAGSLEEAARCLDVLGCAGVVIGTGVGDRELDDQTIEELWALLAQREVFVLVHPSRVGEPHRVADFHLLQLVGYPAETAVAVSRMLFGGVLERHDLRLCLAHGGGCLGAIGGRLDLGWERKEVARTVPHRPSEYLARLHYDTAVFDPTYLRWLVDRVGAQQVLFGSDMPFDLSDRHPEQTVAALGLAADAQAAILGDNARRLLPSLVTQPASP